MKNTKKSFVVILLGILIILGGLLSLLATLPLYSLQKDIAAGGIFLKSNNRIVITKTFPSSPAELAGILAGDQITSANNESVLNVDQFVELTKQNLGKPINLAIERGGKSIIISVTPRLNPPSNQGPLGIALGAGGYTFEKSPIWLLIPKVIILSYQDKLYQDSLESAVLVLSGHLKPPSLQDKLWTVFIGVLNISLGIGLIKFKKWALYGIVLLTVVNTLATIYSLFNTSPLSKSSPILSIVGLLVEILIIIYLFFSRKQFR
ncbi:MAG: PDZ domain-containing protein [Patescibacteria group bacterium]|nr:PDZ domain-containing protein [Patescibacteria group bacterium]